MPWPKLKYQKEISRAALYNVGCGTYAPAGFPRLTSNDVRRMEHAAHEEELQSFDWPLLPRLHWREVP